MMKLGILMVSAALLAGCTSLPSSKPALSRKHYEGLASYQVLPKVCISLGAMNQMTYIQGLTLQQTFTEQLAKRYAVDQKIVDAYVKQQKATVVIGYDKIKSDEQHLQRVSVACTQAARIIDKEYAELEQDDSSQPFYLTGLQSALGL